MEVACALHERGLRLGREDGLLVVLYPDDLPLPLLGGVREGVAESAGGRFRTMGKLSLRIFVMDERAPLPG